MVTAGICLAQTNLPATVEDFKPASSNQPGKQYPQVNSEGRVRASISAPQAQKVQLDIGGKKYDLTKNEKGIWIGDSDPQDEGFHYYQLNIDGASVPDPGSLYFYGASRWGSGIEVPAKDQDFYALKDVPMIIVMDKGYATIPSQTPPQGAGAPARGAGGIAAFEEVLIREIIPMIDSEYHTKADREHRAMAGLSMGANQTIQITINNPDKFSHIGGFSGTSNYPGTAELDPATFQNGKFKDGEALNKQIRLFWLGLGTKEPNPFPGSVGAFRAMLEKAGIRYVYYESQGTAHEWLTWRRCLHEFAPLLFNQ
jgi:enterochelin esterase family protein